MKKANETRDNKEQKVLMTLFKQYGMELLDINVLGDCANIAAVANNNWETEEGMMYPEFKKMLDALRAKLAECYGETVTINLNLRIRN